MVINMYGTYCKMKIVILLLSFLASVNSLETSECQIEFECVTDKIVNIYGTNFTCKNDLVCNQLKTTSCDPCVEVPVSCPFECNGESVDINGVTLNCKEGFVCNESPKADCRPCARPKCNAEIKQYECDNKNDSFVIIGDYNVPCNSGYKCNTEYVYPCHPCISRDENLKQPFAQIANISSAVYTHPKGMSRAILVPDDEMINCNDGKSFLQPCRPGVAGANYYFKCTLSWNLRYSTSIKPCTSLYNDKLCRKVQDLCLPVG